MQEFNDYKLPNEDSMRQMQNAYSQNVEILQNETKDASVRQQEINANINWQGNNDLLRSAANHSPNRCVRDYIRDLIPLNEQDRTEINDLYAPKNSSRNNPVLRMQVPVTFNASIREYIRSETELLASLLELQLLENSEDTRLSIYNIIQRRLDALNTLAGFLAGGIMG